MSVQVQREFKVGDKVRIKTSRPEVSIWNGFEGEAARDQHYVLGALRVPILPATRRPDGHGLARFWWRGDEVELIAEEKVEQEFSFKPGDRVVFDNGGMVHRGRKPGDLGVVVETYPGFELEPLVTVDWDDPTGGQEMVFEYRLRLADEVEKVEEAPSFNIGDRYILKEHLIEALQAALASVRGAR